MEKGFIPDLCDFLVVNGDSGGLGMRRGKQRIVFGNIAIETVVINRWQEFVSEFVSYPI
jgi:hypothetical protein